MQFIAQQGAMVSFGNVERGTRESSLRFDIWVKCSKDFHGFFKSICEYFWFCRFKFRPYVKLVVSQFINWVHTGTAIDNKRTSFTLQFDVDCRLLSDGFLANGKHIAIVVVWNFRFWGMLLDYIVNALVWPLFTTLTASTSSTVCGVIRGWRMVRGSGRR